MYGEQKKGGGHHQKGVSSLFANGLLYAHYTLNHFCCHVSWDGGMGR